VFRRELVEDRYPLNETSLAKLEDSKEAAFNNGLEIATIEYGLFLMENGVDVSEWRIGLPRG
jgi:hypothetical protein